MSALLMGGAPNLEVLLLGRTLYGLGIGFAMHAAPAYIAEAAPARVRGLLIRQALLVLDSSGLELHGRSLEQ
jgi:MFS family permease